MVTRARTLAAVTLALVAALAWWRPWQSVSSGAGGAAQPPAQATGPQRGAAEAPVPRIDLARLDAAAAPAVLGERDPFDYGRSVPRAAPSDSSEAPSPVEAAPPPSVAGGPPPALAPPALNLKYIGSLRSGAGLEVAVLLTDRDEVLTGRPGEVVAHRYRIVNIGLESLDLQELGTDRTRRLPLKGR